jgi:hypothetical protein
MDMQEIHAMVGLITYFRIGILLSSGLQPFSVRSDTSTVSPISIRAFQLRNGLKRPGKKMSFSAQLSNGLGRESY